MTKISFNYSWTITTTWSVFFFLLLIFSGILSKNKKFFFSPLLPFHFFRGIFFSLRNSINLRFTKIKSLHLAYFNVKITGKNLIWNQNERKKNLHEIICHKTNVLPRPRNAKKWQEYKVHSCISFNRWLRVGI